MFKFSILLFSHKEGTRMGSEGGIAGMGILNQHVKEACWEIKLKFPSSLIKHANVI